VGRRPPSRSHLDDQAQRQYPAGSIIRAIIPEGVPSFQASLPLGSVLETPPGQSPVILAYKMNGQLIPAAHGGPVRMVVPGTYGSHSIKWVQRVVMTDDPRANDTDAEPQFNNDAESALKTRARFINAPRKPRRIRRWP